MSTSKREALAVEFLKEIIAARTGVRNVITSDEVDDDIILALGYADALIEALGPEQPAGF